MTIDYQVIQLFNNADETLDRLNIEGPAMLDVFLSHQDDEPILVGRVLAGEFDDIEDELNEWVAESLESIIEMHGE